MNYKIIFDEKEYELDKESLHNFENDENNPILNLNLEDIISILEKSEKVDFEKVYYDEACYNCEYEKETNKNFFRFIEYSFFIFTKNNEYIISNIDKEYEGLTFKKLLKRKKVDKSYIVTITLCEHCGMYSINIEELEI